MKGPKDHYTPTVYFRAWSSESGQHAGEIWREPAQGGKGKWVPMSQVGWERGWSTVPGVRSATTGYQMERGIENWVLETENFWPEVRKSLFPPVVNKGDGVDIELAKKLRMRTAEAFARATLMTPKGLQTVSREVTEQGIGYVASEMTKYTDRRWKQIEEGLREHDETTLKQAALGLIARQKRHLWMGEWKLLFRNWKSEEPVFATSDNAFAYMVNGDVEHWYFPMSPWHVMRVTTSAASRRRAVTSERGEQVHAPFSAGMIRDGSAWRLNQIVAAQAGRWRVRRTEQEWQPSEKT